VKGERQDEEWTLEKLDFRPEGATDWIDLLAESDATTAAQESLNVRVPSGAVLADRFDGQRRRSSR